VGVAFYFALKGLVAAGIAAKRVGDKIVVKLKGSPEEQKAQKAKVEQIVQDAKSQAKYAAFDFTHKVQCHPTISVT
jgi:Na+/glutamate symporter